MLLIYFYGVGVTSPGIDIKHVTTFEVFSINDKHVLSEIQDISKLKRN